MRLVSSFAALSLFASFATTARADPPSASEATAAPSPARVPLRVVRVMPESHQALLFDRTRSTHVLAEVGHAIDGYTVDTIDDDEVTLSRDGTRVVLAAPARGRHADHARDAATIHEATAARDATAVHVRSADARSADMVTADPAPLDPYGPPGPAVAPSIAGEGGVRVVLAPGAAPADHASAGVRAIEPGDGGVRVAIAPAPVNAIHASGAVPEPGEALPRDAGIRVAEAPAAGDSTATSAPADPARALVGPAAPAAERIQPIERPRVASLETPATSGPATTSPAAASEPRSASMSASEDTRPAIAPVPARPAIAPVAAGPARRGRAHSKATAPDDQNTRDARAMAAILSTDGPRRGPRLPASLGIATGGTAAASPAASPATAASPARDDDDAAASSPARPAAAAMPAASGNRTSGAAIVLTRGDVDGALGDFARLTTAIHASFSSAGLAIAELDAGSIFERAGLRAGDVITAVDGARLHSLDDAANLYARMSTASALTAQIVRNGKPVTLHVAIQ